MKRLSPRRLAPPDWNFEEAKAASHDPVFPAHASSGHPRIRGLGTADEARTLRSLLVATPAGGQHPGDPGCQSPRPMLRRHRVSGGDGRSMREVLGTGISFFPLRTSATAFDPISDVQATSAASRKLPPFFSGRTSTDQSRARSMSSVQLLLISGSELGLSRFDGVHCRKR
jgi:hypothetical protein